jgi:hypothetical protein
MAKIFWTKERIEAFERAKSREIRNHILHQGGKGARVYFLIMAAFSVYDE